MSSDQAVRRLFAPVSETRSIAMNFYHITYHAATAHKKIQANYADAKFLSREKAACRTMAETRRAQNMTIAAFPRKREHSNTLQEKYLTQSLRHGKWV